jgi:hypothetical protein
MIDKGINRRRALGVALAGLVVPTDVALARHKMDSRFDRTLRVRRDGLVVAAMGPVGDWPWDSEYGYIAAVVVQNGVKGHGISARVEKGDKRWHAHVVADRHRFRPGSATAYGVLLSPDGREAYSYAWTVPVQLTH